METTRPTSGIAIRPIKQKRFDPDLNCLVLRTVAFRVYCRCGDNSPYFHSRKDADGYATAHRNSCR